MFFENFDQLLRKKNEEFSKRLQTLLQSIFIFQTSTLYLLYFFCHSLKQSLIKTLALFVPTVRTSLTHSNECSFSFHTLLPLFDLQEFGRNIIVSLLNCKDPSIIFLPFSESPVHKFSGMKFISEMDFLSRKKS